MKNNLTILLMVLIMPIGVIAQSEESPNFSYGPKVGINVSNAKYAGEGNPYVDTKSLVGFHVGVFARYLFLRSMAARLELLYSQKGSRWDYDGSSYQERLNYFDVPLLFEYQIIEMLSLVLGPQFGFLMSANQFEVDNKDNKFDMKEYYNTMDIGLVFGAEVQLFLNFHLALRYILGLSSATNEESYGEKWKNNMFQVSIGYSFGRNKK